jgi:KRAB domain-containing zinc finger protein
VKSFECSECGKAFFESTGHIQHYVIHTGEKPFKCLQCGKAFNHRAGHKHTSGFTLGRNYECRECEKAFTRYSTFILHKRAHTGEKPLSTKNAGKPLGTETLFATLVSILERSPMSI